MSADPPTPSGSKIAVGSALVLPPTKLTESRNLRQVRILTNFAFNKLYKTIKDEIPLLAFATVKEGRGNVPFVVLSKPSASQGIAV